MTSSARREGQLLAGLAIAIGGVLEILALHYGT